MPSILKPQIPRKLAQGSLEYLLLIGGAVVIAVIVIFVVLGLTAPAGNQAQYGLAYYEVVLGGGAMRGEEKWNVACGSAIQVGDWQAADPENNEYQYPLGFPYSDEFKTHFEMEIDGAIPESPEAFGIPVRFEIPNQPVSKSLMFCWMEPGETVSGTPGGPLTASGALNRDMFMFESWEPLVITSGACDGFRFESENEDEVGNSTINLTFTFPDYESVEPGVEDVTWMIYLPNPDGSLMDGGIEVNFDDIDGEYLVSKGPEGVYASGDALATFFANTMNDIAALGSGRLARSPGAWDPDTDIVRFCMIWYGPVPALEVGGE